MLSQEVLLSRTAHTLYWMGRYLERAENVARFVDVNLLLMIDLPQVEKQHWEALVMTSGDIELFHEHYSDTTQKNVIQFLTFDLDNPNSIFSTVRQTRENARTVREIISTDLWEQVNTFYLMIQEATEKNEILYSPHEFFSNVKKECYLFEGILHSTMSRQESFYFIRLGRYLERADKTARILDVVNFMPAVDPENIQQTFQMIQWIAVLKSVSALQMFQQNFRDISAENIYQFLILDKAFGRSIYYCLQRSLTFLKLISREDTRVRFSNDAEKMMGKLKSELDYADIHEIYETGIHQYLDTLQIKINQLDTILYDTFFRF
ncbi:MAG: alpha-E domain-containing protein [SAR324 cluster bacterium]|nr:alpha-E domain-containing protein [SAR324 cluster bacterium]